MGEGQHRKDATNEELASQAKRQETVPRWRRCGSRTGDCLPFCSGGCIFERARG